MLLYFSSKGVFPGFERPVAFRVSFRPWCFFFSRVILLFKIFLISPCFRCPAERFFGIRPSFFALGRRPTCAGSCRICYCFSLLQSFLFTVFPLFLQQALPAVGCSKKVFPPVWPKVMILWICSLPPPTLPVPGPSATGLLLILLSLF